MLKRAIKQWNQYKFRFVPWMAININESSPRIVPKISDDKVSGDDTIEQTLTDLLREFHTSRPDLWHNVSAHNARCMLDAFGFRVERRSSQLTDGGTGVFVVEGRVRQGSLVAMYPGAVYQPWEPVFFASLGNSFLFRCVDGVHIDGKDTGLSKMMYNSFARRDCICGQFMCDQSWLSDQPVNPLAIGQYVNNQSREFPANVTYQEYDVPANFPQHLKQYLPNIDARMEQNYDLASFNRLLRTVVLVALRDIDVGEELFSTYYTIVQSDSARSV